MDSNIKVSPEDMSTLKTEQLKRFDEGKGNVSLKELLSEAIKEKYQA